MSPRSLSESVRLARRPGSLWTPIGSAALALGVALPAVSAAFNPAGPWGSSAAVMSALLCAGGLWTLGATRFGWRATLVSPLAVTALVLIFIFALRPLALVADPRAATPGLLAIEFSWTDLTRTVGMGTLGFAAFGLLFLLGWRSRSLDDAEATDLPSERRLIRASAGALAVGTALWGALFLRNGGIDALLNDPARLHLEQFSGGYGVLGFMLCLGSALVLLWALLQRPSRAVAAAFIAAAAISVAAAFALQTRGPLVSSLAAGGALVLSRRRVSTRTLTALACAAALLVLAFGYMRTVREYSQVLPLSTAVSATVETSPLTILAGEFTEVENFVALERLVPDSLPRLSGRSFRDVPAAFVPRQLWADKPLPIDFELARRVYGAGSRAGTPFTLAGELFWNFGMAGVLVGMAAFGAAAGLAWRALTRRTTSAAAIVTAIVFGYSYLVLTRPLGPMLLTLAMALAGFLAAALATGVIGFRTEAASARRRSRRRAARGA